MSRLGRKLVPIPAGVTVEVRDDRSLAVRGPRGELTWPLPAGIELVVSEGAARVRPASSDSKMRPLHGLSRQLLAAMVGGVTEGYQKRLEMKGTGYRAEVQGSDLVLMAGFSHPVRIAVPAGIIFKVEKNVVITVEGNDKQLVGEMAARIRAVRPPEPYKGKGIRYLGEQIRLKPGKAVKTAAA